MSVRNTICRQIASWRFRQAGAELIVCSGAQIRSLELFPISNGHFLLGEGSIFCSHLALERHGANVSIGPRTFVGKGMIACSKSISIGADVLISWGVAIVDHQSHNIDFSLRADDVTSWLKGTKDWTNVSIEPVQICDKVWIGFNASVLPGVTIGEGAVIGAASVVTRDVEPWTVVAGNPARVIKRLVASP